MGNLLTTDMKRIHKKKSGLILIDILVALALGTVFVMLISQSSQTARDLFEYAHERNRLLSVYEAHAAEFEGMMPYESRQRLFEGSTYDGVLNLNAPTTTMRASAHWYGNDRIQMDITISTPFIHANRSPYAQSITFNSVRAYPFVRVEDSIGTPLCSVDFANKDVVGSYSFLQRLLSVNSSSTDPRVIRESDVSITPIVLPIDPLLPLTDMEVRGDVAYVSSDSAKSSDPDILAFDIRDPENIKTYFDISTGPGLASIVLGGDHIFVAQRSAAAQLQVIRMPYQGGVLVETNYKLPLPYATATPPYASAIFFDKGLIYLGTEKWLGEEFSVIDVSDPARPNKLGGLEIGSKVNDIFVRDGVAYVAASDEKQLRAVDVSDPVHPMLMSRFSPSGWERQEGKTLSYFEDSLAFGRTSGGFNIKKDHELFSWLIASSQSSSSSSTTPDISLLPDSTDISGGVYGIVTDRSHVFVATRQADRELQIFDRSFSTTTVRTFPLPVAPQTMTCDGDRLYILAGTAPVIYQITFK